jgi:plastocyanin domain-containing protein
MPNNKNGDGNTKNGSGQTPPKKKNLAARLAAQRAAERALNRKRAITIAVIVLIIGAGVVLFTLWGPGIGSGPASEASFSGGEQLVTTSSGGGGSGSISVRAGTKVVWTINAGRSLGCQTGFQANGDLGIARTALKAGETTTVTFTPSKKGTYTLRCLSMGMRYCTVTVT